MNKLLIGCIADDFTGASDIGSFFTEGGLRTLLVNGVPDDSFEIDNEVQVLIIALKTRSIKPEEAVEVSKKACSFLVERGCRQIYFKYCSTFDSTRTGNIGPVIDAVLEEYDYPYTIICPSLPVNGRIVKNGCLYVHGEPLHESPMRNHPVNPMWDCSIKNLMEPQGKYKCLEIGDSILEQGKDAVIRRIELFREECGDDHFYVVPDYFTDEHAALLSEYFSDLSFLTGGSGLALPLAEKYSKDYGIKIKNAEKIANRSVSEGRALIIAGSCSVATTEQIDDFVSNGGRAIEINPSSLMKNKNEMIDVEKFLIDLKRNDILVYTSRRKTEEGKTLSEAEQNKISRLLENTLAELAYEAVKAGVTKIVVAGGETSGAVVRKLGYNAFYINESVAPGVPVMDTADSWKSRIVLKSGNFGQKDFFRRALRIMSEM